MVSQRGILIFDTLVKFEQAPIYVYEFVIYNKWVVIEGCKGLDHVRVPIKSLKHIVRSEHLDPRLAVLKRF